MTLTVRVLELKNEVRELFLKVRVLCTALPTASAPAVRAVDGGHRT